MRICVVQFLVLATSLQLFAATSVNSQSIAQTKVNLELKNATLVDAFNQIEAQTAFRFAYHKKDVKDIGGLTLAVHDKTVAEVLKSLFANTALSYKQVEKQIVITADTKNADAQPKTESFTPLPKLPAITIAGKVTDSKNQPLPGITVAEKGTSNVTATDVNGNYKIAVAGKNAVLIFRSVGYVPYEVTVGDEMFINATLTELNSNLNEVVVVGYTTQKRSEITGAISAVKGSDLAVAPVDNITNSIAGRVTGVIARQTGGGQPGNDNTTFSIRGVNTIGNNAPLIVVDGIIRNNINQIDPNAIESVTILKDAAAVAPYGLGGANGVVLITTKSGKIGLPTLTLNSYYGVQTPTYYPKVLNAVDYMNLYNEAATNDGATAAQLVSGKYPPASIPTYMDNHAANPDRYPVSNSRDLINFHTPEQSHNLEVSGGSDKIRYYTNLGFFYQAGEFPGITYSRYAGNIGLDANVTNTTKITLRTSITSEISTGLDAATNASTIYRDTYKLIPTDPVQFSNGLAGSSNGLSLLGALNSQGYTRSYNFTVLSTLGVEQQLPLKGLSIKATVSYDPTYNNAKRWHLPFYYYTVDYTKTPYAYSQAISTAEGPPAYTYLAESFSKAENFTYQGILNYHNTFGKHSISGLIVAEARNGINSNFNGQINNYSLSVDEFNFGSSNKNDYTLGGTSSTSSQVGYVYTVEDVFDGKYSLQASGRYDGHYYFAPGHQYAFFPAFSGFWTISRESFMQKVTWVNNLKLRASWGKSGMLAGGAYQFLNAYNLSGNAYAYGNNVLVQGTTPTPQANPNITWEQAIKTDIGLDGNFFGGWLNLSVDVYKQLRSGMLYTPSTTLPAEYGITLSQLNGQTMEGSGVEFALGSQHRFSNGMTLGINGTFSYNTNKMTQIFEAAATYNNPNRRQTGRPYQTQFGYHALGLFQKSDDKNGDGVINAADGYTITQFGNIRPGDIKYQDVNGDGKIDANDQVPIGYTPQPLIDYGLNITAAYKGFDLTLFFQGTAKSTMGTMMFLTVPFANNSSNTGYAYYNDHWSSTNPNGHYPIADSAPTSNNTQASDFWNVSGAYLRLKTAQLGYSLPMSITKALKIKTLRFYVAGQNLLTFSKLNIIDPEIGSPVSGTSGIGGAGSSPETLYPISRVITGGLTATF